MRHVLTGASAVFGAACVDGCANTTTVVANGRRRRLSYDDNGSDCNDDNFVFCCNVVEVL